MYRPQTLARTLLTSGLLFAVGCGQLAQASTADTQSSALAQNAAATDPNATDPNVVQPKAPTWKGIFIPGSTPKIYLSPDGVSCDSNQLKAGQEVVRLELSGNTPDNYNWVDNFKALTIKGVTQSWVKYDQQCNQPAVYEQSPFDIVQLRAMDGQTATGTLDVGAFVFKLVANFEAVSCGSDPFAVPAGTNTHCALPESCDPVVTTCVQ